MTDDSTSNDLENEFNNKINLVNAQSSNNKLNDVIEINLAKNLEINVKKDNELKRKRKENSKEELVKKQHQDIHLYSKKLNEINFNNENSKEDALDNVIKIVVALNKLPNSQYKDITRIVGDLSIWKLDNYRE